MSSLYELQIKDGLQIDTLTDPAAGLRIQVNRHGAEPISIARRLIDAWIDDVQAGGRAP